MDTTEFSEGQYVSAEIVKASNTKVLVIIDEAKASKTDFGEQLVCKVQIDGKFKIWRLNRDSVKNMQQVDTDSVKWIGCKVRLQIISSKGKEQVLGFPIIEGAVSK